MILDRPVRLNKKRELIVDKRDEPGIYVPGQTFTWEKAWFTVPIETPHDKVMFLADRYQNKWGKHLEGKGFTVLSMETPEIDLSPVSNSAGEDRRRYILHAKVSRPPVTYHVDVPDKDVPLYQKAGYTLQE